MVIIGIIGCLFLLGFLHIALKDVISPPFVLSGIWLFAYIALFIFKRDVADFSSIYYLSYFASLIFFVIGFILAVGNNNKIKSNSHSERDGTFRFKLPYIQIFLLVAAILFVIYLIKSILFISQEGAHNFWHTLHAGKSSGKFQIPLIIEYSRSAVIALNLICGIVLFTNPTKRNKRYFYISGLIALFYVISAGNRGAIIMWLISLTFSYLYIRNFKNKKLLSILLKLGLGVIAIFIITNFTKYVYADQSNAVDFSVHLIDHYFSSSTIAFVEWMKSAKEYVHGANTFRFFLALLNSVGFNIDVPELVQEEIQFYGDKTNIYTVLHYYARDFGLMYAFAIQLFLGIFHGLLYKKVAFSKTSKPFYIALLSIFFFPLINQFFDDKYFSILSTWIQITFWIWLFTRRELLVREEAGISD